jgi:hypothetical protein
MTISPAERARQPDSRSVILQDGATLAVVGGGPAGAFFAILAARKARALGKALDLVIIEKNSGGRDSCPAHIIEGCNYCAGGISPNLFDILNQNGIHLPEEIIEGKAESVIVHGDWKSLELPVPKGRTMLSVFRGTRPQNRPSRYENFDAFLLDQAVLTELKSKARKKRRLANVLWKIASGDDSYSKILRSMAQPAAIWTIFWGGALMTFRNALAERLFGLRWQGIGRYQTGVAMEDFEEKRQSFLRALEVPSLQRPEFSRMYSIRIKAGRARVLQELGRFGDGENGFFSTRRVVVRRISGAANELGSTLLYDVSPRFLSFRMTLEKIVGPRILMYRVLDGFARKGIFVFGIDPIGEDACSLSIYVAYDFPRGTNTFQRSFWRLFRLFFPGFVHDVIWNHSLCRLKHLVEADPE